MNFNIGDIVNVQGEELGPEMIGIKKIIEVIKYGNTILYCIDYGKWVNQCYVYKIHNVILDWKNRIGD